MNVSAKTKMDIASLYSFADSLTLIEQKTIGQLIKEEMEKEEHRKQGNLKGVLADPEPAFNEPSSADLPEPLKSKFTAEVKSKKNNRWEVVSFWHDEKLSKERKKIMFKAKFGKGKREYTYGAQTIIDKINNGDMRMQ